MNAACGGQHDGACVACTNKIGRERRASNPEIDAAYQKNYYENNKERKLHANNMRKKARRCTSMEQLGLMCGICGEYINPALEYPNRLSFSIDHIVPLSVGDDSSSKNLQAAHLICNIRKSNHEL